MRLMMQSLLADRFGLKIHFEDREMPVLEMSLLKPGQPGPKLIRHAQTQDCDAKPARMCFHRSAMAIWPPRRTEDGSGGHERRR